MLTVTGSFTDQAFSLIFYISRQNYALHDMKIVDEGMT